ncbi:MAG TPA: P-II family nitrogen regulator [Candidatus Saccharicenans sp.]|jgi:nitrogen regulatory protein PII|nr:P-II family nitrogen regulator [Candidatus Saccharicenans sp.]
MTDVQAIVVIVERGKADSIVDKAKEAGAEGATILFGRGTGQAEFQNLFHHLHVEASKEIIIILCDESKVEQILEGVVEAGKLREPGKGIAFTFSVSNLVGLEHRQPS